MDDLGLPREVAQGLKEFVESAQAALGPDLLSSVLFGSAAQGRLRANSDVNVILVLARFDPQRADMLREPLRTAHALIRLEAMLLLESEIGAASEAFAVKFADILERHKLLCGKDPFAGLAPSRGAMLARLRQILLNFISEEALRGEFLRDPAAVARGFGLDEAAVQALAGIDRDGLVLAADSFERKRLKRN